MRRIVPSKPLPVKTSEQQENKFMVLRTYNIGFQMRYIMIYIFDRFISQFSPPSNRETILRSRSLQARLCL